MKDKIVILLYLLSAPIHYFYRFFNIPYAHTFIREVTIKNKGGIFFCGNSIQTAWITGSFHEDNISQHFKLKEGVFVDIGAHVGKFTVSLAHQLSNSGFVIAIEPEPYNFSILKKNIQINNLGNVHAYNLACSSKKGNLPFYVGASGGGGHSLLKQEGTKEIKVKVLPLDTILSKVKSKISLIKVDVEGAEIEVLKGARKTLKKYHPNLIFETWTKDNLSRIREFLSGYGYTIYRLDKENYLARAK